MGVLPLYLSSQVVLFRDELGRRKEEGKTEHSFVITEDVLLLAPLAFVLESLLRIRTQLTVTAHKQSASMDVNLGTIDHKKEEQRARNQPAASVQMNRDENNFLNIDDKLMSIDANQKECGQILNSVTTLGTIDKKKDELRARNREYQRQYRERRKNKVCIGDQNLAPGNNPVTKEKKHDNQVSRIRRRTLVGLGVEQSCQNSIPVEHCVNTCVPFKKTDKEPYNSGIFEPENPIHGIEENDLDCLDPTEGDHDIYEDDEARVFNDKDFQYECYMESESVAKKPDRYDFVYNNLPKDHFVLRKVPNCAFCHAKRFPGEGPAFCCRKGLVNIFIPEVPDELQQLFTNQTDADAKYFRNHIRIKRSPHLDAQLIIKILNILENNPYVQTFRSLGTLPNLQAYTIALNTKISVDQRRFNAPTMGQVAAIWMDGNDPQHRFERSIIIYGHENHPHYIRAYHGCYDPLAYPLFYPNGETGWEDKMILYQDQPVSKPRRKYTKRKKQVDDDNDADDGNNEDIEIRDKESRRYVSAREYLCFRLQIREGEFNIFFWGGRLFQQWAVDMYVKVESMRLDWYSKPEHQDLIRADLYQGLIDTLAAGEARASEAGKRIVLSKDFHGSDRDVHARFMDAMTLVTRFGKPDLFITMTCNPYWNEIMEELLPGQIAQDRPDVVTRVYRARLLNLHDDLIKKGVLGKVAAYAHVTEFQKRGLPHEHFLLIMEPNTKLRSPDDYDKFISAELPDPVKYPVLHKLVCKHMMHGPCDTHAQKIDEIKQYRNARCITAIEAMYRLYGFPLYSMSPPVLQMQVHLPVFQMPCALRRLFATIMVFCECANVRSLWDKHFESMAEDYRRSHGKSSLVEQKVLRDISNHLASMGRDIRNYGLPELEELDDLSRDYYREFTEEMKVGFDKDHLKLIDTLNVQQRAAFDEILDHVLNKRSCVFFVDGPGGTGKTYLYKALLAKVRSLNLIAIATATSGIAASIMPGGRTAHSRFKVPIKLDANSMCNFTKQSGTAMLLREASLIIWDEVAMTKRQAIETLDRTFQDIMGCDQPFGGKVMLFGGDFRQVLPVVPRGTRAQITDATLLKSYLWENVRRIRLTQNMRARNDKWFSEYLLRIGNGTEETYDDGYVQLPDDILIGSNNEDFTENSVKNKKISSEDASINILIDRVFPNLQANCKSTEYMRERAILSTRNEYVDAVNALMIDRFPGEEKVYYSFDSVDDDSRNNYPIDFLNTITPNGLPPHELKVKKNCPVILLRNLDPHNGLCNGTRLIIRGFQNNSIDAEIVNGQFEGTRVFIPRIPMSPSEDLSLPFKFKRKQFPIRLSFAMTINKAQGQTIPNVGIYLPEPVFSHGQLYVALSRGVSRKSTWVLTKTNKAIDPTGKRTKNIVYRDILEL
ncbi:uncharacterized protein [Miscanthus floridulus]|uniref:uncharacterized protein n=1 Tax=Miscanthus floridulus TaxID=154761 RepID=UPI003458647D